MAIINISNRLPVSIGKTIKKSSGGLVSALEGVIKGGVSLCWVGWPGGSPGTEEKRIEITDLLKERYGFIPVWLDKKDISGYYEGFSNSSLWPVLHYMTPYMRFKEDWWESYVRVNTKFAEAVLPTLKPGDTVWVHDYHLFILPELIKAARPDVRVGFFLHTPFPSYEVFRCHPKREELLKGLAAADLVGFHTFGYLRHFRSSVMRILGYETEINRILKAGHTTYLGVYPIGIDSGRFAEALSTRKVRNKRDNLLKLFGGKKIVLNVERLDYTKGILHKLEAIEVFLKNNTDKRDISFIFICVPSRGEVSEYRDLKARIEQTIGEINGRYATLENTPVHFIYNSIDFEELCALYSLSDVAMVTPLIDGMNLVAKEYIACQTPGEEGVLILSEFAGAAIELFSAITVNPYDSKKVAEALERALTMDKSEKQRRIETMRDRINRFDALYWAKSFLKDLSEERIERADITEDEEAIEAITALASGTGRCALFLDYDGTLAPFTSRPEESKPSSELIRVLEELRDSARYKPFIISGRKPEDLEKWLGHLGVPLIAEHGNLLLDATGRGWESLGMKMDLSWKTVLKEILEMYEGSTPGSHIEEKAYSLVWHYRNSDPEFGLWKAQTLESELMEITANLPVQIIHGKKVVEAASMDINKGKALENICAGETFDLVIAFGDDQTDENMFFPQKPGFIGVKIGKGDTKASYRLKSPEYLYTLLKNLIRKDLPRQGPPGR